MEKNKIIVGNMKMNLTYDMIENYINRLKGYNNFVICPSSLYLPYFIDNNFEVGIQNISEHGMGSYTGEISVKQAKSIGVKYAIVGHSDRRDKYNETDEIINETMRKAVSNDLISILCVGETLSERISGNAQGKIKKQLVDDLHDINCEYYKNIVVAYEPIWSIGTGKIPSNEEIEEMIVFIKRVINHKFNFTPLVLYGGSINEENIEQLKLINNVDGFLVGGASLIPDKIIKMIETVN